MRDLRRIADGSFLFAQVLIIFLKSGINHLSHGCSTKRREVEQLQIELRISTGGGVEHIHGLHKEDLPELNIPDEGNLRGADLTSYTAQVIHGRHKYEKAIARNSNGCILIGRYPVEREGIIVGSFIGIHFPDNFDSRRVKFYRTQDQDRQERIGAIRKAARN